MAIIAKIHYTESMTLTEFSYEARILIKIGAVILGVFALLGFMLFLFIVSFKKSGPQTALLRPSFNKVEKPLFDYALEQKKLNFVVDTIDGELPVTTSSARVFFIPDQATTLQYLKRIYTIAQGFGFLDTVKHQTVDDTWVKFEDETKILKINIKTFHLDFIVKPTAELQAQFEATPEANFVNLEDNFIEFAKEEMSEHDAYPPELASGKTNIVYVRYDLIHQVYYPVKPGEIPQGVRIDFFRVDEDIPVVPPRYFEGHNYVILSPVSSDPTVVALKFSNFEKLNNEPGIYPVITSAEAWNQLTKGNVTTISLSEEPAKTIKIRQIYLAYYDPESYQKYFQPIFVFLGDNSYVGYLPAIVPSYYLK